MTPLEVRDIIACGGPGVTKVFNHVKPLTYETRNPKPETTTVSKTEVYRLPPERIVNSQYFESTIETLNPVFSEGFTEGGRAVTMVCIFSYFLSFASKNSPGFQTACSPNTPIRAEVVIAVETWSRPVLL